MPNEGVGAPRISVVIPVFNGARTIARALKSVLDQTHRAHEIVVIDDGSTDETPAIVRAHGSPTRLIRQANAGPAAARNRGVEACSGEWIAFLDADDWYYPERLALHATLIREHPDVDFVIGNFDYRDAHGEFLRTSMADCAFGRELLARLGEQGRGSLDAQQIGRYLRGQFSDTRTLTVPRQTFRDLGGFPQDLRICEDLVFLIRLCARSSRAGVTCRPTAVYCLHDAGLIRSDRYRAQEQTVRGLRMLGEEMATAPPHIRQGWIALVKDAYMNFAYYLARAGRYSEARRCIVASFRFRPAWSDLRRFAALLQG